jgi:hypothetical protein
MMEIDQVAALRTTLDFHLLPTQSNPPARKFLPPLWIAPGAEYKQSRNLELLYNARFDPTNGRRKTLDSRQKPSPNS